MWTAFINNPLVAISIQLAGLYVLALFLAMVFWTVRDAQQRTENPLLPYLAGLLVVVLNVLGLFLYLIVRPKETLGEAYERQLAEESLLAEAEQRVVCPTCKERVQEEFILCPTCRTRLKRVCPSCGKLIRPEWNICPYCAKDFDERDWTVHAGGKQAAAAGSGARDRLDVLCVGGHDAGPATRRAFDDRQVDDVALSRLAREDTHASRLGL